MRKVICGIVAIAVVALGVFLTPPEGLSHEGLITLSLFVFVIVSWIGDLAPKFIATLVAMILLYVLGVADSLDALWKAFISSIFFFLLAAFALATVVKQSSFPVRLMRFFIRLFGSNSKFIVLAFMTVSAFISAFMSDLAACALIASVVLSVTNKNTSFSDRFVKCLMIGVPIGSLAGGFSTPIGSPTNITIMVLLESFGETISFAQWMLVGVPLSLVSLIAGWVALMIAFRPEPLDKSCFEAITEEFASLGKLTSQEKKAIVVMLVMVACWIAGTWIPLLSSTLVAVCGMCVMFFPGIELLKWKDFQEDVPWDLMLMLGGLMALASFLNSTGSLTWIVDNIMVGADTWSPLFYLFAVSAIICLLRSFLPSGPPVVVMLAPGLIALSLSIGLNPFCVIMAISVWCQITFLMPSIDALYLITYSTGRYTIPDVLKFGIPLTIVLLVLLPLLTMPLVSLSTLVFA